MLFVRCTFADGFFMEKNFNYPMKFNLDSLIERHGCVIDLFIDLF